MNKNSLNFINKCIELELCKNDLNILKKLIKVINNSIIITLEKENKFNLSDFKCNNIIIFVICDKNIVNCIIKYNKKINIDKDIFRYIFDLKKLEYLNINGLDIINLSNIKDIEKLGIKNISKIEINTLKIFQLFNFKNLNEFPKEMFNIYGLKYIYIISSCSEDLNISCLKDLNFYSYFYLTNNHINYLKGISFEKIN